MIVYVVCYESYIKSDTEVLAVYSDKEKAIGRVKTEREKMKSDLKNMDRDECWYEAKKVNS